MRGLKFSISVDYLCSPFSLCLGLFSHRPLHFGDRRLDDVEALREKFPGIPVAIVSHGAEQFLMTRSSAAKAPDTHQLVQSLVNNDKVDFHVCGTHASWLDVMPEDFPDYVDVAPAAPAQIRHYEDLGYELIVLP